MITEPPDFYDGIVEVAFPDGNGLFGVLVTANDTRFRIIVHSKKMDHYPTECLGMDMVIPWAQILWLRRLPKPPFECELCLDGGPL